MTEIDLEEQEETNGKEKVEPTKSTSWHEINRMSETAKIELKAHAKDIDKEREEIVRRATTDLERLNEKIKEKGGDLEEAFGTLKEVLEDLEMIEIEEKEEEKPEKSNSVFKRIIRGIRGE